MMNMTAGIGAVDCKARCKTAKRPVVCFNSCTKKFNTPAPAAAPAPAQAAAPFPTAAQKPAGKVNLSLARKNAAKGSAIALAKLPEAEQVAILQTWPKSRVVALWKRIEAAEKSGTLEGLGACSCAGCGTEGLGFLKKLFKSVKKVVGQIAPIAGPIIGGVIGGPAGAMIGQAAGALIGGAAGGGGEQQQAQPMPAINPPGYAGGQAFTVPTTMPALPAFTPTSTPTNQQILTYMNDPRLNYCKVRPRPDNCRRTGAIRILSGQDPGGSAREHAAAAALTAPGTLQAPTPAPAGGYQNFANFVDIPEDSYPSADEYAPGMAPRGPAPARRRAYGGSAAEEARAAAITGQPSAALSIGGSSSMLPLIAAGGLALILLSKK